jgi:glycosyltransferase involved in cell wall biosynthesis
MNILFLDQFSELGGAQRCLLDLLPAIEERGWRAHAALPGDGPLIDLLRSRNVGVERIPCGPYRSGSKSGADFLRFPGDVWRQTRVIRGLLRRHAVDLIYVNGARVLPAAALAARGRVPVLFHVHFPIRGYAARLAGLSLRRADATVAACCRFVALPLRRYVPRGRLRVIVNGTPDAGFRERAFGAGGRWRIGVIGRIAPEKGQTKLLQAAALLAPGFPEARFVICGAPLWAKRKYYDEVRRLAQGLPVDFLEWQDDVAPILAELDLLVIPSGEEGMPRILLEAFSAGLPVVAFPASGIPEAIEDDATGFLVPESSPEALAARIRGLTSGDPERLARVARHARDEWERCYTLAAYREEITGLMRDLVWDGTSAARSAPSGARSVRGV